MDQLRGSHHLLEAERHLRKEKLAARSDWHICYFLSSVWSRPDT